MSESIIVHGGWLQARFFIWGEAKPKARYEQIVNFQYPFLYDPFELKLLLFRHDKLSFYGTFIDSSQAIMDVPLVDRQFYSLAGSSIIYQSEDQMTSYSFPVEGIALSVDEVVQHWMTFTNWSTEKQMEIAPDLCYWLDLFAEIRTFIKAGSFLPNPQGNWVLEDFPIEKWAQAAPPSTLNMRQPSSMKQQTAESKTAHEKIQEIISLLTNSAMRKLSEEDDVIHAINDWKKELPKKWETLVSTLLKDEQVLATVPANKLQEQLRTKQTKPFQSALLLLEPAQAHEDWYVQVAVSDRANSNLIVGMDDLYEGNHPWLQNPIPLLKNDLQAIKNAIPFLTEIGMTQPKIALAPQLAYQLYTEYDEMASEAGFKLIVPKSLLEQKKMKVELQMATPENQSNGDPIVDWHSLAQFSFQIAIGDQVLTEQEFREYVNRDEPFLHMNGEWLAWDRTLANRLKQHLEQMSKKASYLDTWLINEQKEVIPASLEEIDFEIQWDRSMTDQLVSLYQNKAENIPIPDALRGSLRPYQLEGASWLYHLRRAGFGACLADDMGLGKSIQTIAYILHVLKQQEEHSRQPFLLICPTSLLFNWQIECDNFAPDLKVFIHHGASRLPIDDSHWDEYDLILTSYQMAVRDQELLSDYSWNGLILDEAQHIKNIETKQRRTIKAIHAKHRIALTGTPIENKLRELWSLIDVLIPGLLGRHYQFQRDFIQPIERNQNEEKLKQLQHLIFPFILRRKKSDEYLQLGLPLKTETTHRVPLSVEQAMLYQMIVDELLNKLDDLNSFERRAIILKSLTRLKQICNHPAHFLKDRDYEKHDSEKWNAFMNLIQEITINRREKVLIFTQYKEMGTIISDALHDRFQQEIPFLHGSLTRSKREEAVKSFQENPDIPAFILSLKAGGVGLNLTAATHVIHYDRWWNPAVENQATDRAFRIGQKSDVTVHKFITIGTLEERIDQMLQRKQGLANEVLTVSENRVTELSNDEIVELIHLQTT
ncbi:DEAD/DEAH box helicase [Alkalihalobacillus pseudalcaliphilus]|uniref:DEAD/DEAH box helicase n=1 Tax=Alkalihalobacillus pseudalcaliphilus TaxID=79884 RepID=UPI00064DE2BB|nr:DEAD/DEAH box helicase [Alkalihalobacillus pseudalcaliphilus]KMK74756.1 helicase SNF2 [Alkalihalobacillus pseudalcaliphilus]